MKKSQKKYNEDDTVSINYSKTLGDELAVDAIKDTERLTRTINSVLANPKNWIVSEIKKDNYKVEKSGIKATRYCALL